MNVVLVLAGFAVVGVAIALADYFSERQRVLRAIRSTPLTSIRDAEEGSLVRLKGRVSPSSTALRSPVSQTACVAYRVLVTEKAGRHWRELLDDRQSVDFWLDDGRGRALVRATAATLAIVMDSANEGSGFLRDASPALDAFLTRHGLSSTNFLGMNRSMRCREGTLHVGETIVVAGFAHWEDDPDPAARDLDQAGYRQAPRRKRLVLRPGHSTPIMASDDPSIVTRGA